MRITKAMLEETNASLRSTVRDYAKEQELLKEEIKYLKDIIRTYSNMTPLIIASERIADALAHTVQEVKKR